MSSNNLNSTGQATLAVIGSFVTNAVVHPLATIKNRLMATSLRQQTERALNWRTLYHGYTAICITDSLAFGTSYVVNGLLNNCQIGPLASSILSGMAASPIIAIGEGCMVSRQVNGVTFSRQMLINSMNISGLMATMLREVPFCIAVFSLAPATQRRMNFFGDLTNSTLAGLVSGMVCGAVTAPADKIKTLVQSSNALSFRSASLVVMQEFTRARRQVFSEIYTRSVYIGLAVAILNVINNKVPHLFPYQFRNG